MKRILFVDYGFGSGGAEHQCTQLVNMLVDKGYHVEIATFGDVPDHYYISPAVIRVRLAQNKSTLVKVLAVEKFLLSAKYDVVFAFSQRMSCIVLPALLFRANKIVISSERNFTIGKSDKFENILVKTGIYRRANYIVPNNYSQGRYLSQKVPFIKNKIQDFI